SENHWIPNGTNILRLLWTFSAVSFLKSRSTIKTKATRTTLWARFGDDNTALTNRIQKEDSAKRSNRRTSDK
ncbi:hypothetical protein AHF37_12542, partial [Paragonimus kellicotti]